MLLVKKIFAISLLLVCTVFLNGSGYKGTLPDLNREQPKEETPLKFNLPAADVLPLDKLTIPVMNNAPVDKTKNQYVEEMTDIIRQLERLKEILDSDKSFKNFVAAANILNLTATNFIEKFPDERFAQTNEKLSNINYDTQQIKDYWIKINKNAPYVSYYTTKGAYSGAVLNEQLNNFSKVLEYAIQQIKDDVYILTRAR